MSIGSSSSDRVIDEVQLSANVESSDDRIDARIIESAVFVLVKKLDSHIDELRLEREDMRVDRKESMRRFNRLVEDSERDRQDSSARFDKLIDKMNSDSVESNRRFNLLIAAIGNSR